ncbi:DUF1178 family protein [Trinickia caryophylli]|uniref:DUF1178 family protein n=1 Tax=Trinickia caryophylli TaxID=28094 RepID=A0A1X7GVK3_TRICW|nr:DUF1178 family protein [Trinickia caryophylli]PMS08669.1 DUF1178 domain-containing protein [Trinickia caryophylli]WQE11158.1 DUF1178 family protein [Trinickia caryophylli]GLU35319.1 hypothetical protein Busp01_51610 [Trinickia caryophylli]SMF75342.1 hypothetical protein SAMN06295900_118122 [Trinickia caryophylli]
MKVLDLQCSHGHRFEGWFASAADFESQLSRKLVECPICAATEVSRVPSAPRLNLSGATAPEQPAANRGAGAGDSARAGGQEREVAEHMREVEARVMRALREAVQKAENVGNRFAEEARRIHYNEAPARTIRGVASPEDARSLAEEGIDVMPLPGAWAPKETLQ